MSSNLPPGVTGNEVQIHGPFKEWTEIHTCPNPDCGWWGEMTVQYHPDHGTWALCGNPDPIDGDADDNGRPIGIWCPNSDHWPMGTGEGFAVPTDHSRLVTIVGPGL